MNLANIRPYQPEDRPDVERICVETGLGGKLDEYFCDRELFVKLWLAPYLDVCPEHCRVAISEGKVVGYLVATFDPDWTPKAAKSLIPWVAKLVGRWMSGRYRHHNPTSRFVKWFLTQSWRELPKSPKNSCQFHFNVDPNFQGSDLGIQLGRHFVLEAKSRGMKEWYCVVITGPGKKSRKFYERLGFVINDSKPFALFGDGAEVLCCVKQLGPESTSLLD